MNGLSPDTGAMTNLAEVVEELERSGYAVIPRRMDDKVLAAVRAQLSELLEPVGWGSGFDGTRTKRIWALLAKTRCMDQAALDPLVLDVVEQAIGPGTQFSITFATQVHPGQSAQVRRPCTTRSAPCRASSSAVALPIPEVAPVTSAVRPSRSRCCLTSSPCLWSGDLSCEGATRLADVPVAGRPGAPPNRQLSTACPNLAY